MAVSFFKNDLLYAQIKIEGVVYDSVQTPISDVLIRVFPDSLSLVTNRKGEFKINLKKGEYIFQFSHINFETYSFGERFSESRFIEIQMKERSEYLRDVEISDAKYGLQKDAHLTKVSSKDITSLPSATGDFSKVLATLPGVSSNNELSTAYSVRGGNYDENLIYVNGIKIYRPQIVSAGRQEGLSFINPDLVRSINFSAGAWRANFGDKLSSVLDIEYQEPTRHEATVNMSLLGGSFYYGGVNENQDLTYTIGIRHKNTKYLLGTLETQGEYLPNFTDFQSFIMKKLSSRTKIGFLASAAFNDYHVIPAYSQTDFGTIQASFRLNIAFEGQEKLNYQTYQVGTILTHSFTEDMISRLIVSGVKSSERENYDVLAGYLLCDVNNNPGSNRFNECASILGIGTNYKYGRNRLEAEILNVSLQNEVYVNNDILEYGINWDMEVIEDQLKEYTYVDSADFVNITAFRNSDADIKSHKLSAYAQYTLASKDSSDIVNAGVRINYWTYSGQALLSPRFQYIHRFNSKDKNVVRFGMGIYQQHPFYRELRDRDGLINPNVKAQSSAHIVGGWDHYFTLWNRPFKMTLDAYYKYLWDVNMYDVDNVKIRYFANNDAVAVVYGTDFRINGEFIPGVESWFSVGLLHAQEAMRYDTTYISPSGNQLTVTETGENMRRPTDQRLNLGIFFQDHIPGDPTMKVSLNFLYGSGLPFGPPNNDEYRNSFDGDDYARVDVGFTKSIKFYSTKFLVPNDIKIGLEVLNLLGTDNTISYNWIQDVRGINYAVPNALSARFLNLRIIANF
ncbi:MAG: TonB-dependent receptor plug domain-containing protein [Reichenbachiella sp.]